MSNKQRKIFIVDGSDEYANWCQATVVDRMEDADICMWTGGADVSPSLYGKRRHPTTWSDHGRDLHEQQMFDQAFALGKPLIGICRGCQFLSAMSGAILVQDQDNPAYLHDIETYDGQKIVVSSTHHQASYPWLLPPDQFKVLGWSVGISPYHKGQTDDEELVNGVVDGGKEVEIVYFPLTRALCIQSHPEGLYAAFRAGKPDAVKSIGYCRDLLDKHLAGSL